MDGWEIAWWLHLLKEPSGRPSILRGNEWSFETETGHGFVEFRASFEFKFEFEFGFEFDIRFEVDCKPKFEFEFPFECGVEFGLKNKIIWGKCDMEKAEFEF